MSLFSLFRRFAFLTLFVWLPLGAWASPETHVIKAEKWDQWVFERYQILEEGGAEMRTELRETFFVVKERWMATRGYELHARTPERLDEYARWLKGRSIGDLITLAARLKKDESIKLESLARSQN